MSPDLHAIAERYHHALNAKPSKGPYTEQGIAAITDSVSDVPELLAEIERLNRWQAEALPVMDGLQELGSALGLPLGERITGPAAVDAVEKLRENLTEIHEWAGQLADHLQDGWLWPHTPACQGEAACPLCLILETTRP